MKRFPRNKVALLAFVLLAPALVACRRPKVYETTVEVARLKVIRTDDAGAPLTTDVEFSYAECPGTQFEVIRGGKEFSECVAKLTVGDKVKVKLEHHYDAEGFYDFDVFDLNGCPRPPDPNDEASFKMVRECESWMVNGAAVGFQCSYEAQKELKTKCPWFRKH